ncbi:ABC transporter substrate-binding protein [Phaeovulum vinaykumarii]|uniref:Putative spermidine/putrescine transport system substrate-binding protein n=1 Tax=Phaeovulum vinaykumarii TaxID=407234 RepID=A0A1N7N3K9_9RHOB|nr:ABC transporter substrate-binding protein [Phaeovulum vinaykumarii]SIS92924.1 putative spermidine/putrescine transport system substrate-binding protein [Phaeovulum vinaykumarii]SOC19288.1 putative spermidine/putrescine transport system substrate-binding protein [Phaeovulum vinaykumarii]
MKKLLLTTVIASSFGLAAQAEVVVMSWGGAYGAAQTEAHVKPFIKETGIDARMIDADNPAAPVKAQTESGNVSIDVALVEYADAVRLCDEGLLEEIDPAILPPGSDGTPAMDDFLPGAVMDCGVSTDLWDNIVAYDSTHFPDEKPSSIADFFDLEKFPGKRGIKKNPKTVLEMALMADGVPAAEVYDVLSTPEGVDRAFAKLDTIKDEAIWWEAGAQPPQLLADGEVVMTTAYNGRIFNAAVEEGKPLVVMWDGQVYEHEMYVIPKGAPHLEDALKYIQFATSTEGLRAQAQYISYGPTRRSSNAGEILFKDGKTVMGPHLPTYPANMENALETNFEFWVDNDTELNERFNAWLVN